MMFPGMGFSQIFANNNMSQQPRPGQQRPMNQNMMPGMNPFAGPDPMQMRNQQQMQRNPSAPYGMPQNPMQHMMQFANQFRGNQGGNQNMNAMGGAPRFGMPQGMMNSMRKR